MNWKLRAFQWQSSLASSKPWEQENAYSPPPQPGAVGLSRLPIHKIQSWLLAALHVLSLWIWGCKCYSYKLIIRERSLCIYSWVSMWIVWIYSVCNSFHPSTCLHSPAGLFTELLFGDKSLLRCNIWFSARSWFFPSSTAGLEAEGVKYLLRFKISGRGLGGIRAQDAYSSVLAFTNHFSATWCSCHQGL